MKIKLFIILICGIIAFWLLSSQYGAWEENLSANISIQMDSRKGNIQPAIQAPIINQAVDLKSAVPQPIDVGQLIEGDSSTGEPSESVEVPQESIDEQGSENVGLENDRISLPESEEQQTDTVGSDGEVIAVPQQDNETAVSEAVETGNEIVPNLDVIEPEIEGTKLDEENTTGEAVEQQETNCEELLDSGANDNAEAQPPGKIDNDEDSEIKDDTEPKSSEIQ